VEITGQETVMGKFLDRVAAEPVLFGSAIRATLVAAMAFGFNISIVQLGVTMLAVEAVLAFLTRQTVTPVATLPAGTIQKIAEAKAANA
jgi:hypothetical protein